MTDLSTLKSAFEAANHYNDWSTAVVVLGLMIEFAALLLFSKEMSRKEKTMLVVGSVLVAAGVGGEYVFSGRAAKAAIGLQQASDERIATLTRAEAADRAYAAKLGLSVGSLHDFVDAQVKQNNAAVDELKRDTSGLQQARTDALNAADGVKKDLAAIRRTLDEERKERDKFAKLTEDRLTKDDGVVTMGHALANYAGQMWTVTTYWDSKEPLAFSNRIKNVLDLARWNYDNSGSKGMMLGGIQGVYVYVHPKATAKTKLAADALVKALSDAGFDAAVRQMNDPNDSEKEHDRLALTVGSKN